VDEDIRGGDGYGGVDITGDGAQADRRYSPSIGIDLSEWEIILDELICMGYIVKEEPDSDYNE
jgi:hypothetical protein